MQLSIRRLARVAAVPAVLGALLAASAAPASAAYAEHPSYFSCGNRIVSVPPVRVWTNSGTQSVYWALSLERWNGSAWVSYSQSGYLGAFTPQGENRGWSVYNTTTGGRFVNSRMNESVRHQGHYRVTSAVTGGGVNSAVYVAGGNYCWMP